MFGALATALIWQDAGIATALVVGGIGGGVTGTILGAYFGLIRHRPQLWQEEDWGHVEVAVGEVLIVLDAEQQSGQVREILERHGGRRVEPIHPS